MIGSLTGISMTFNILFRLLLTRIRTLFRLDETAVLERLHRVPAGKKEERVARGKLLLRQRGPCIIENRHAHPPLLDVDELRKALHLRWSSRMPVRLTRLPGGIFDDSHLQWIRVLRQKPRTVCLDLVREEERIPSAVFLDDNDIVHESSIAKRAREPLRATPVSSPSSSPTCAPP